MNQADITKIVKKYGLEYQSRRDFSLFSWSCVSLGYGKQLKKILGFGYKSMGVIGKGTSGEFLYNLNYIAQETEKLIKKIGLPLIEQKMLQPADQIFQNVSLEFRKLKEILRDNPKKCLEIICTIYPQYLCSIAIYNCFLRYQVYRKDEIKIPPELLREIGDKREKIAKLYPKIESLVHKYSNILGKKYGLEKDLLNFLTLKEMQRFLTSGLIADGSIRKMRDRKKEYFYLFVETEDKEHIFTDKNIIKDIRSNIFNSIELSRQKIVRGKSAFPGFIKGVVYNLSENGKINNNYVLVASMTRPADIAVIKKCQAIVTDEGGMLCHATIVAREFKKPCIVGTKNATKVLKDGDLVEVDANLGTVKIIKSHARKA